MKNNIVITPITVSSKHKLIKSHKNHIKEYGFMSDLLGTTKYGIDKDIIDNYEDIITVFTESGEFYHINELQIPIGTFDIYGVKKEMKDISMMSKATCKNCKHWERRTLYKYEYKNKKESWFEYESKPDSYTHRKKKPVIEESKFGYCNCEKIIYTSGGGCVEDDDVEHQNQPDAFLYSDGEAYGAYHYTGENFGCVHFRTK